MSVRISIFADVSKDETDLNMKKSIAIPVLVFSGVVALSAISNAYALYTLPSSSANFGIFQAIDYYLKGTFNSWNQENTYKFVNNTNSMTPEEGKIKEYKLENIPLNKAAELKVWANNDVWFKDGVSNCTYEHHWSNSIAFSENDDHNYIVPMTSNTYSFYLKFYNNGSSKLHITANKDILYFIPSNNWKGGSATFAIERYNNDDTWANNVTDSVENPSGTFKFVFGTEYSKYKFARRNEDNSSTWNASNVQTIGNSDTNNCFTLWDKYWGNTGDVWSGWNAAGGEETGVSCGSWSTK